MGAKGYPYLMPNTSTGDFRRPENIPSLVDKDYFVNNDMEAVDAILRQLS